MEKKYTITLRLTDMQYTLLGAICRRTKRTQSEVIRSFIEKYSLPFHLISDPDCVILKAYEAWGLKKLYGKESWGTLRTTYVIDGDGIITDAIGKVNTKDHTSQILGEE